MTESLQAAAPHHLFVFSQVSQGKSGVPSGEPNKHQVVKRGVAAGSNQGALILGDCLYLRLSSVLRVGGNMQMSITPPLNS